MDSTKSSLYKDAYSRFQSMGSFAMGPLTSEKLRQDPQYVMFQMSRYKHASRILSSKMSVMDIGAGDGVGLPILCSYFKDVVALDIDQTMLDNCKESMDETYSCEFVIHDFTKSALKRPVESAVCFDVLSLIPPETENSWIKNIASSLCNEGMLIIGTQNRNIVHLGNPNNHVDQPNFKDWRQLKALADTVFKNTIILAMNDEMIHTGKRETCQYLFAICIGPK